MNKTTALDTSSNETAAAYEADVDQSLAQMRRLQQQITNDREEIAALQAETRAILASIMHTLRAA